MAADQRGTMLARIADLRGKRLTREANEAHEAAEAARLAAEQAHAERAVATAARDEARQAFNASPGCAQARLWLDRKIAGETGAVARLSDRSAQIGSRKRFLQIRSIRFPVRPIAQHLARIPRHEQLLHLRSHPLDPFRQRKSTLARHPDVGQHELNRPRVACGQLKGLRAAGSAEDCVAVRS